MKRFLTTGLALVIMTMNALAQSERFCIAKDGKAAAIVVDEQDWKGVIRAANDLSDDVRKVTGTANDIKIKKLKDLKIEDVVGSIIVGTIGKSRVIDKLIKQKKLDVSKVRGQWESFVIDVVDGCLVVAGSDKRGTIYGIYEISQRIGVSPWYWWADVPVRHQDKVYWEGGRFVMPSPTVKYRGIFINDEDWGLKPWASTNYEKELGDIGPKTYARVCELLLRLRANMLAPAMHSCTGAFYSHPESKVVCDSFGIIITTSHCEPLLLNNAAKSEWDSKRDGEWNYKTNPKTIWKKWDERLSEASQYENIYTVAMRGVHDEGLRGNLPMEERVPLIQQVISDQRQLLEKHIGQEATDIPQIFVPYKETMDIYENGLKVPDDITLVWVDDNYGYMKRVADPEEQKRSGGSGVYYHISYLGAPHDYLWINTTPPVLMYEELKKAYDAGADRYWLLNVGDIKPMELGMQTFFDMAWDINAFSFEKARTHQADFLTHLFASSRSALPLGSSKNCQLILDAYYRLAWSRKPEFMGWEYEWDDKAHTGLKPTEFSFQHYDEAQRRLAEYQHISDEVQRLADGSAAWFELLQFPIQGAYQMNRKFLMAQLNQELLAEGRTAEANWAARQSQMAFDSINALNLRYNEQLGGKWRGMMNLAPAFRSLSHLMPEVTYTEGAGEKPVDLTPKHQPLQGCHVISLATFIDKSSDAQLVGGLGYDGQVILLGEATYQFPAVTADSIDLVAYTVPIWPLYQGRSNAISISIDGGSPQVFENKFKEYSRSWKDQVMRNGATCRLRFAVDKSKASHTIRFTAEEPGQMLQRAIIDWGGLQPSYIGPQLMATEALAQAPQEKKSVFIYSPNERAGLHIAQYTGGEWQEIGQLCSSDYGTWGVEKRMYHPSVARANDGTWRLVFQVNDRSPLFAASYSRDLVTWRPQDYPVITTPQCLKPVIFANENGTFDIYYQTQDGDKRWVSASNDFRQFCKDEKSLIDQAAWTRDTATIAGKLQEGCLFEISPLELCTITTHFDRMKKDGRLSSERMYEDAKNAMMPKQPVSATLTVTNQEKAISDKLIGIFFEDISYAADGGLYAEMVQNRDFEYCAKDRREWNATTAWHSARPIEIATEHPLSQQNPHYALLWPKDTLWNEGWDGMSVVAGQKYDFSMYVLAGGQKQTFLIQLVGQDGTILGSSKLKTEGRDWTQYATVLSAKKSDAKARLAIIPQGIAHVGVDMISLFPQETFMHRKNGLRKDLAETIAAMKPKFMRFPGGCMSHGQGLENIYHWNHTVGPLQERKPDFNIWGYHQTRGLGFFEYFQFCEDIGAEPLPVLAAGVPCQNSAANAQGIGGQQGGIPMDQMPAYIQELLDMIDWANGDPATSKWAKMRADAGHPAPFNLKYIGIGNEDIIGTVFEERYEMICKAIRQKYPEIKICGTVGPFHTPSADYIEGWDFTKKHPDLQYMVDEHYYESTGWFMHHRDYYDSYDRSMPKVYLGEYAASTPAKRPNVETALAEALYLTDVERNGDVVEMTSYAPMLCKDGHSNWNPDMIYFSNTEVRPTPAYDVQRLFSVYGGDRYLSTSLDIAPTLRHRVAASLVRDSKTGRRYLKLVNALPVELTLTVNGLTIPAGSKTEGFSGQPEDQKTEVISGDTEGGALKLPPYTFQVIVL